MAFLPFGPEAFQQGKFGLILLPSGGAFAGNDVPQIRNLKNSLRQPAGFRFREAADSIGRKDQIHILGLDRTKFRSFAHWARWKPKYSGRFFSHHSRYSAIE